MVKFTTEKFIEKAIKSMVLTDMTILYVFIKVPKLSLKSNAINVVILLNKLHICTGMDVAAQNVQ